MSKLEQNIGWIGGGQMARALASGFLNAGIIGSDQLYFADPSDASSGEFVKGTKGKRLGSNLEVVQKTEITFLATKPQVFEQLVDEISGQFSEKHLIVSVMGGITLESLQDQLQSQRVIRVMPNTPCLIGRGALGFCCSENVHSDEREMILSLLQSVGVACEVPDRLMNAVTAVSGSGPAYVYTFVESLIDAGVNVGLPRPIASQLAMETVLGSAEMINQTGQHPAVLRDQVTSPGGTTIAGQQALEDGAFRSTIMNAVEAAVFRAKELAGD